MSCLLDELSSLKNLKDLLQWLCPHLVQDSKRSNKDEKVVSWDSWEDELENSSLQNNAEKSEEIIPWLEECFVAASPLADIIVIACRNRISFLTSRWESNENKKNVLAVNWKGTVGQCDQDEISSVICLPIISQKQSSSGAPDWTCIVVAFTSGYIEFYTESGLLLLTQIFEESAVVNLFCRTYTPKNFGACIYSDLSEELVILYHKSVVSIDGFSLLQALKACRNQAAKAAASGGECSSKMCSLGYKKWSITEQEQILNCVAAGMLPPHLYDHLMQVAFIHGFNQAIPSGVPTTFQLLTTGKVPFFGVVGISEGAVQPFIADVAMHYASKIKDALFNAATGWLFGNKQHDQNNKKEIPKIEQAISVPLRYSLPDKRRIGISIKLSLNRRLAAITDDFGRITLIDAQKCCVLRMFKGYRDAECGWITVDGEWRDKWREVSFLIIYAPRRSLLEVWLPQQGPRVAAFNVPKDARLLYTPHTLLGANTQRGVCAQTNPVILLSQDGTLVQISIPFHLALSGKTGKQARDVHLLKTLKISLRNDSEDQVLKIITEIQTTGIKLQVFSLVVGSKFITESLSVGMIDVFLPASVGNEEENRKSMDCLMDHESRILIQQLRRLKQLLELYQAISSQHLNGLFLHLSQDEVEMKLSHHLLFNEMDLSFLITTLRSDCMNTSKCKQVSFNKTEMTFSSFIHCWEFNISSINKEATSVIPVQIKNKLSEKLENSLGEFMFGWKFNLSLIEPFYEVLSVSGVNFSQLLNLAFLYWLNLDSIDDALTLHMSFMIFTVSIFSQPSMVWDPSSVNPYWESVRCTLMNWCKPLHAFTATLICKGVEAATLMHGRNIASELKVLEEDIEIVNIPSLALSKLFARLYDPNSQISGDSIEVFEGLSLEMVEWNLLLNRFQKLLSVHKLFNIISQRGEKICAEFSIKTLSNKGKGYLSELISKWLIAAKLSVNELLELINSTLNTKEKDDALVDMEEDSDDLISSDLCHEPKSTVEDDYICSIKDCMQEIQLNFPESMKKDVIICNLAWEYGSLWKKMPLQMLNLEAAVLALKSVENPYLKHGIGVMMWETWIVHYVQSASLLIEKFRRTPNDQNSLREIGISEFNLHKFFLFSKNLLEIISTGNEACNKKCFPSIGKDDFWSGLESPPSLVEVAVGQNMTSSDLTFLHLQLLCVLCLIVQYSIKIIRPFSLFPERDRAAFFKPLFTVWRETTNDSREVVNGSQLAFLNKVISASVVALPDSTNSVMQSNPSGLYDSVELGRTWGVSVDALRRHYVCELYSSGLDTMADQALIMIRDGVLMASQMIVIAGQRLHYLMTSSNKSIQVIALVTPPMKDWCKTLDTGCLRSPDQPIENTYKMVYKAKSFLSDTSREYRLAQNLYTTFERIDNSGLFNDIS